MAEPHEVVKKLQELLHDLFFVIVFFLPYRFTGDCDYSNKYNYLVLQTIFCMTSLPNSITSNILSRGRRQQSRRRQRCSRRQRQRQLRGSEVPRAGLGEEDFFLLKPYRFGYRSVIVLGYVFSYVFLYVEASMQCNKKRITRRAGSKWKLSNCWLYKTYI